MSLKIVIPIGLGLLALLVGVDIYLAMDKLPGNTWSEILRRWAVATPLIPWIYGVLGGHFYHPIENLEPILSKPGNIELLVWLTILVGMVGLGLLRAGNPVSPWVGVVPGFVVGALLWPV